MAAPFGPDFPSTHAPFAIFGNEPKSYVTPWRLALFGRLLFKSYGVTLGASLLVNGLGIGAMLLRGVLLDRDKRQVRRQATVLPTDPCWPAEPEASA